MKTKRAEYRRASPPPPPRAGPGRSSRFRACTTRGPRKPVPCRTRRRRTRPAGSFPHGPRCRCTGVERPRSGSFLDETGLVNHHHPIRFGEMLQNIGADHIPDTVLIPRLLVEKPPRFLWPTVIVELGERPPVLTLRPRQQAANIRLRLPEWLVTTQTGSDTSEQLLQPGLPHIDFPDPYAARYGRRCLFDSLHTVRTTTRRPPRVSRHADSPGRDHPAITVAVVPGGPGTAPPAGANSPVQVEPNLYSQKAGSSTG